MFSSALQLPRNQPEKIRNSVPREKNSPAGQRWLGLAVVPKGLLVLSDSVFFLVRNS